MTCTIQGCEQPAARKGWCWSHYKRWKAHGDPNIVKRGAQATCAIPGCDKPHNSLGLCRGHYTRYQRDGGHKNIELPLWTTTWWSAGTICPWCGGTRNDGGLNGICYAHWVRRLEEAST